MMMETNEQDFSVVGRGSVGDLGRYGCTGGGRPIPTVQACFTATLQQDGSFMGRQREIGRGDQRRVIVVATVATGGFVVQW
jgi:hypothetical protein